MYSLVDEKFLKTEPSGIRVVFEQVLKLQKSGKTITRLDIGSPNFKAPEAIIQETCKNLQEGRYQYSSNWGVEALRRAISNRYMQRANIEFDYKNEVIVTNGASEAVAMVICSLLNSEEHFLIPTPAWSHYVADCRIFGKQYKEIKTSEHNNFKLTPDDLLESLGPNSKVLILNSPTNPTGSVYTQEEFQALYDICVEHDILLILDEIYEDINYEFSGTLLCADISKSHLVYINGFSKNFGMTGFRIGFLMADAAITNELIKYHQYTNVCGQAFVQQACADFLADPKLVNSYHKYVLKSLSPSQQVLLEFQENSNITMTKPSGAFYSFARIPDAFPCAKTFCFRVLEEKNVSLVPGEVFGLGFERYYRISYGSVGSENLRAALNKILRYY